MNNINIINDYKGFNRVEPKQSTAPLKINAYDHEFNGDYTRHIKQSPVSLAINPCKHELNDGHTAKKVIFYKGCQICQLDANSSKQVSMASQAIVEPLKNLGQSLLKIKVVSMTSGRKFEFDMPRDSKAIDLYNRISEETGKSINTIKLVYKNELVSVFNKLSDNISSEATEVNFSMQPRMAGYASLAADYNSIFLNAMDQVGPTKDLEPKFLSLYKAAILQVMIS